MDLAAVRVALAEQVAQYTGRAVHAYPYPTGGAYELPAVVVWRRGGEGVDYHVDQGTECDAHFTVHVVAASRVVWEDGLRVLDELLSSDAGLPRSVVDAIETDPTLGGVVEQVVIGTAGDERPFNDADGNMIGVVSSLPVAVWAVRT